MGRPSKLSPAQWSEVERRAAAGEGIRALAREFKVDPAIISRRVSQQSQRVRNVAHQVAAAHAALAELPLPQQYNAMSLAEKLRSISTSLASAADLGAKTAHRLHALANSEVSKIDDAQPMASIENLRNVGVLTKLANESAHVALNLLSANKEAVQKLNAGDDAEKASEASLRPQVSRDEWLKQHGLG